MTFLIVTHAIHTESEGQFFSYGPYVREMNLWIKDVDKVLIIGPLTRNAKPGTIDLRYEHKDIEFIPIEAFDMISIKSKIITFFQLPGIFLKMFRAMQRADHIHLRCPGNMGLLGLFVQFFFPFKKKTVKYAGNWDDYVGEHPSYKLQKYISKNTYLTKRVKVLIYGQWHGFTKNCLSFFTASYKEKDKQLIVPRMMNDAKIRLVFLGTLDERKRPEYAIDTVSILAENGFNNITLDIIGEGPFEELCKEKIIQLGLQDKVKLHGNVPPSEVAMFLNNAHFLVFLSRMEGWPKVVAESMWWGCVPITTAVSCVPWMLDNGERGMIVERTPSAAVEAIMFLLKNPGVYLQKQEKAVDWSREYTLERFEQEVKVLIRS